MFRKKTVNKTIFESPAAFDDINVKGAIGEVLSENVTIRTCDIFRYLLSLVFSHRSMYMQLQTGSFKEDFVFST